jgi:hypothetical protein
MGRLGIPELGERSGRGCRAVGIGKTVALPMTAPSAEKNVVTSKTDRSRTVNRM